MIRFPFLFLLFCAPLFFIAQNRSPAPVPIKITWTDNVKGDFSFTREWSYIYLLHRKENGQLVCDGLCPEGADNMLDSNLNIIPDSVDKYYQLVDTSHIYHTIESEVHTYEYAGNNFATVRKLNKDSVYVFTHCNPGTHSSLHLYLTGGKCLASIGVNSITNTPYYAYPCYNGYINIDRNLWKKGILKAEFCFYFKDDYIKKFKDGEMFWKGRIEAMIMHR